MSKELARERRPRRVDSERADAATRVAHVPASARSTIPASARNTPSHASDARSQADALRLQSAYGNSAVGRAARAGDKQLPVAAPDSVTPSPAYSDTSPLNSPSSVPVVPSFATPTAPDTLAEPSFAQPSDYDFSAEPLLVTPSFATPLAATPPVVSDIDETLIEIYPPETEPVEESESVETIVFEEEEIVGGVAEEEKEAKGKKKAAIAGETVATEEELKREKTREEETAKKEVPTTEVGKEKTEEEAKAKPEEAARKAQEEGGPGPREEEVKGAEAKAGGAVVEADAEGAKEGAPTKEAAAKKEQVVAPGEAAGGGAAPELADWKSKVSGATKGIKPPDVDDAPKVEARVRKVGGASGGRAATTRKQVEKEAEKVVPPPPAPPDPLPTPEEDPTGATQLVRDASGKTLPNQTLPVLEKTPLGTMPTVAGQLSAAYSTKVMTESAVAEAEKAKAEAAAKGEEAGAKGEKDPQREKGRKVKDAKKKKKPVAGVEAPAEPLVLVDEGPPPPAPMTKSAQTDVGKVLAVLVADPHSAAVEIVKEARGAPYEGQLLEDNYDDFGTEVLPEVETELSKQLDSIREAAGITKEQLDTHVADRKKEVMDKAMEALSFGLYKPAKEEKEKVKEEGQKNADAIAGARETMDLNTEKQLEAAAGDSDPAVIKSKRERLMRGVGRKVAQQVVAYTQAGERREKALGDMESPMQSAYVVAARADETKIYDELLKATKKEKEKEKEEARQKAARDQAGLDANKSFVWVKQKLTDLTKQIGALKTAAKQAAGKLVDAVRAAGERASEAIREWAGSRIKERQSWWQNFLDRFREWGEKANYEAEAWEQARNSAERDAVVRDLDALRMVEEVEARGVNGMAVLGASDLTAEQRAVVKSYYEGLAKGNKIAAVAAGMRARLSARHRPGLIDKFKAKLLALPRERWEDIDIIAHVEQPGGMRASEVASEVYWATEQWGTDEGRIYKALANLTPLRAAAARKYYSSRGWGDMDAELRDELSGAELTRAQAQMSGDQALADAAALREAMKGGITGIGTDEGTIMQVLRNKSPEEQKAIIAAYKRQYGDDLDKDIKGELSSYDLDRAKALRAGDTMRADAIALDQSMHGGVFGDTFGGDKGQVEGVYSQMRQEVEAEAALNKWDAARTEEEIKKRHAKLSETYADVKGIKGEEERKNALRGDLKKQFSGPEENLVLAIHDNDLVAADAARIEIERRSVFYASDDTLNKVFKSQGERARRESERDAAAAELKLQERIDIAELRGFPIDEKIIESERGKIKTDLEANTKARAAKYMSSLEKTYDEQHGKYGKGSLQIVIALNMSGTDRAKARDLVKGGGLLTPEQELDYAMREEDGEAVQGLLAGKKKEDVEAIVTAWEEKHKPRKFADYVEAEFEGRDLHDIKKKLKGEPQTPEDMLARAQEDLEFEKTAYGAADYFATGERRHMENDIKKLEAQVARLKELKDGNKQGTPEYEREFRRYQARSDYFKQSVKNNRAKIDSVTDTVATIAAIVATVVAIVVISVLTAGAGTALLAAVMAGMTNVTVAAGAAVVSTLVTVGVKRGFKGKAYTKDEWMGDLTVGAVEAVASGLTAGLGGKLLAAGRLAKLSQSSKVLPRLMANALAEGAEGFASSLPGALTGALVNKQNWKGDPFANIAGSTLMGVGMGTVLSGGMGMLGGISKPAKKGVGKLTGEAGDVAEGLAEQARKHPPIETPDMLAKRGSPLERAAGWDSFQKSNPGKSYDDFIAELDAGIVAHKADDQAVQQMNKRVRDELFTDVPPGQRDQFKDVVVDVVSDADFERLTRSAKGQAVVLIENGKPRVLLRESADPKVLREEGIYLLQSVDPKTAHLFRELDESVLKKWDDLPLDEQLSLYNKKLDLEIDGQKRLIKNLEDSLGEAGDDKVARKQILDQLEEAGDTLDNLSRRLDEVGELTPQKRLDIADGKAPRPDYLDQPARLFSKKQKNRLIVKQELVAALKKAGHDASEANRVLERLRQAAHKKGQKAAFDTVAATLNKLPPAKAAAYLDDLGQAMDAWVGHDPKGILAVVEASTKMKDPAAFLHAATKIAGTGKDATERVARATLDDIAKKVAKLDPAAAHKYLDDLGGVLDAFKPKKPRELSGFIQATTQMGDSKAFTSKLKDFANNMKQRRVVIPDKTMHAVGDALGALDPVKAAKYLDALDDFTRTFSPRWLKELDGFIMGSRIARSGDPAAFLTAAKELVLERRFGISREAIVELAAKAGRTSKSGKPGVDVEWLVKTDLFKNKEYRELFNFMAEDSKTSWNLFRRASKDPTNTYVGKLASSRVRGIAGEFLTFMRTKQIAEAVDLSKNPAARKSMNNLKKAGIEEIVDRQVEIISKIGRSEIDFKVRTAAGIHGLEVKTYSKKYWMEILSAWDARARLGVKKITQEQLDAVASLDHMIKQLKNAATLGNPPFLMTSDMVDKIGPKWKQVFLNIVKNEMPKGTKVVKMSEADIRAMSDTIKKLLGM